MANQYRSVLASGSASTGGNAVAANVLAGKTFTNDNGFDTGTMVNNGAVSQTLSAGQSYTIPEGYHNGNGTVTAGSPSTFEISGYNTQNASQEIAPCLHLKAADVVGKTTIKITSAQAYGTIKAGADVNTFASLTNLGAFDVDLTIPSFTSDLYIYIPLSLSAHGYGVATAVLS